VEKKKKQNQDNMDYIYHLIIIISIYSVLSLTMNILVGYLGILYLAHPAIAGIGAYTFAILTTTHSVSFFPALLAAGIVSMIGGFILSLPTFRLKSHYIGMCTLAFLLITNNIFINSRELTRGALGIPGIPRPTIFGEYIGTNTGFLIFTLVITIISCAILHRILNSPFSKVIETIREDEIASKTIGKNTAKYKIQAFLITSFFGGIFGAILASYLGYINPWNFAIPELILLVAMVVVGGMASFWGSILGAIIITLLPETLRFLQIENAEIIGGLRHAIYGLLIILFMIFRPNGILGKRTNIFSK
jgi:branched-chain amino acid transport system permease protein